MFGYGGIERCLLSIAWRLVLESCHNGHIYNQKNTYVSKVGKRHCRECHRINESRRLHKTENNLEHNRRRVMVWRKNNPVKVKQVRANWLLKLRALIDAAKANGCEKCPEKHIACLDFHHRDPATKSFNIGVSLGKVSLRKLKAEIAKCNIICSNCHRKLHWQERNSE